MRITPLAILAAGAFVSSFASAPAARAQTPSTSTYVEHATSDGQDVRFTDDPLTALAGDPVGAQLTGFHPPRRFNLMPPRTTFVPEMLKTVEHL
jgi:hypothetical protein